MLFDSIAYASRSLDSSISRALIYCSLRSRWVLKLESTALIQNTSISQTFELDDSILAFASVRVCYPVWVHVALQVVHLRLHELEWSITVHS